MRAHRVPIIDFYDPYFITIEHNGDDLFVSAMSPIKDFFVHGVYKTFPHTEISMPNKFCLAMDVPYFESSHDFDFVDNDGEVGIFAEPSNTFHKLPSDVFCINVRDRISNFSSAEFIINFDSNEVKEIVEHFDRKSIVDLKCGYHQTKSNLIYFRRNAKGKIFLEVRDHRRSYSAESDTVIDEEKLHIPLRVKVREFIHVLKTCSENSRGVVIEGKGFTSDQDAYLKMIDEDTFARYEYFLPYIRRNYY